jgi:ubiquinone/menaquinone biosynthesis C-methylase UbiE
MCSAPALSFLDKTFDLVVQSAVFNSILDFEMKQQIASEMLRVLKDDGLILWYDYHVNNLRNP